MSTSQGCPERAAVETPRGNIVTRPVIECRRDASAETGVVETIVVQLTDDITYEVLAEDAMLP